VPWFPEPLAAIGALLDVDSPAGGRALDWRDAQPRRGVAKHAERLLIRLLRVARAIPLLRSLRAVRSVEFLDYPPDRAERFQGAKPPDLRFELLSLSVVSLAFIEEFEGLAAGIRAMHALYRDDSRSPFGGPHIDDILNPEGGIGTSWANCGVLLLPDGEVKGLLSRAALEVYRVSPSIACLSITAVPSDALKQRLEDILTRKFTEEGQLAFTRTGRFGVRLYGLTWMPHQLRAHAVDALLADANESLTTFLRKHIRVEGTTGPRLPGVVVFAHRRASEELGKDEALSFFRDAVSVEEALGAYRSNGVTLLVPRFSWAATRVSSQRVAVSIPELLDSRNTEGYATEEDAVELARLPQLASRSGYFGGRDFCKPLMCLGWSVEKGV